MLDKNATEIGQSNACTGRSIEAKTENNNVFSKIIHHYYQLTAAEKKWPILLSVSSLILSLCQYPSWPPPVK